MSDLTEKELKALDAKVNELAADPNYSLKQEQTVVSIDKNLPILVSLGITKNENGWVFFKMTTQNDKVLNIEYDQDNLRSTCIQNFKITAQRLFMEE